MGDDLLKDVFTHPEILYILDGLNLIDISSPMWLNLNHHDPREYLPEKKFNYYIEPVESLDDISHIFVPSSIDRPIPVSHVRLPFVRDEDLKSDDILKQYSSMKEWYLNFLVSARPASPKELPHEAEKGEKKMPPVRELERRLKKESNRSMFQPHIPGLLGWVENDTIFYYSFGSDFNSSNLATIAEIGLEMEGIDYLSVRDPQVSFQSRVADALPLLLMHGVLSPRKKLPENFHDKERVLKNARFNMVCSSKLPIPGATKILFKAIDDEVVSGNPFVSYFPWTTNEFGKNMYNKYGEEVISDGKTQTLPIALTNRFNGEEGLFNCGMYKRFGPSNRSIKRAADDPNYKLSDKDVLEVMYWNEARYAKKVSEEISDYLHLKVQTVIAGPKYSRPTLRLSK